jgi:putative ABC transport system permease protein
MTAPRIRLIHGRLPVERDELAISEAYARRLDAGVGDTIELRDQASMTVVGLIETSERLSGPAAVSGDPSRADEGSTVWLIDLPVGEDAVVAAAAVECAGSPSADCQPRYEPLTRDQAGQASDLWLAFVFVLGSLALVEAALIAAAAFAVGIRRRQRELGLLGAVGATPRQMAANLLAEGLVAGLVATALGVVAGIGAAFLVGPWLDGLADRRVGGVDLDPRAIVLAAVVGIVAALLAAAVPAWSAARLPTLVALSGRRPPSAPAHRLLVVGLALIAVAVVCTVAAPLIVRGDNVTLAIGMLVVGSIAGVLGFGSCSPWLLERLDRPARHLPLAARIAVRDTSRARTRNGPIVTAVLASVAGMIALASLLASATAYQASQWQPSVPEDILRITGDEAATLGPRVADVLGSSAAGPEAMPLVDGLPGSAQLLLERTVTTDADDIGPVWVASDLVIGDESMLAALGGATVAQAFRDGAVVVFAPADTRVPAAPVLELLDPGYEPTGQTFPVEVAIVPTDPMDGGHNGLAWGLIPVATAQALGITPDPGATRYTIRLDHAVTQADLDAAAALMPSDERANVVAPIRPPDSTIGIRLLMLGAALVVALSVTAVAVALGESEARPDLRTLLTLGADRRLRRRVTAARGAVLALLAGVLAVPAGLLPVWGVLLNSPLPIVVPVPEVIGAIVVLPLMAIVGGLLLGRPLDERSPRADRGG